MLKNGEQDCGERIEDQKMNALLLTRKTLVYILVNSHVGATYHILPAISFRINQGRLRAYLNSVENNLRKDVRNS